MDANKEAILKRLKEITHEGMTPEESRAQIEKIDNPNVFDRLDYEQMPFLDQMRHKIATSAENLNLAQRDPENQYNAQNVASGFIGSINSIKPKNLNLFHGTNSAFETHLINNKPIAAKTGPGVYLTNKPIYAENYAQDIGANIRPEKIENAKILDLDNMKDVNDAIKEMGFEPSPGRLKSTEEGLDLLVRSTRKATGIKSDAKALEYINKKLSEIGYTGSKMGREKDYAVPIYNIFDPSNVKSRFGK